MPCVRKPFTSDDDIVVCPECGAPYHRACYQQAGHCIFQEKHGTPDAWKPPEKQTETDAEGKTCPRCGKKNARESLFCDQCGQLLSGGASKGASPNGGYSPYGTPNPNASPYQNPGVPNSPPYQNPGAPNAPYSGPYPFAFDPMGGVRPEEPLGDGVTAGDAAKFVQTNPQYYIPAFVNRKRYHRNRFNFSAFLCSGGWMLYRKQYKWGAIFTGIMLLIYVLSTFISYRFATPIIMDLMQQVGVDINCRLPDHGTVGPVHGAADAAGSLADFLGMGPQPALSAPVCSHAVCRIQWKPHVYEPLYPQNPHAPGGKPRPVGLCPSVCSCTAV